MKRVILTIAGCCLAISLQAAQVAANVARQVEHDVEDVAAPQENGAQEQVEQKEIASLRLQLRDLEGQLDKMKKDYFLAIPGFSIKATPARFVFVLTAFNCLQPIKAFNEATRNQLLQMREGGKKAAHIIAAARITAQRTESLMEFGKELKDIPAYIPPNEVLVFITNEGVALLKINAFKQQLMQGLSADRDQLLFDLGANLLEDERLPGDYLRKYKQKVIQSSFDDPQKQNLCINYFNQSLEEVEKELKNIAAAQAMPIAIADHPITYKTSFYQRHKTAIWIGGALVVGALTGGGVVYYYMGKATAAAAAAALA